MTNQRVLMTAVGSYLPANVVTNEALSSFVDTDDAWIRRRTGIAQRHLVADGETMDDGAMLGMVTFVEGVIGSTS